MAMCKKTVASITKRFRKDLRDLAEVAKASSTEAEVKQARVDELNRGIAADRLEQRKAEVLISRFEQLLDTSDVEAEAEAVTEEAK